MSVFPLNWLLQMHWQEVGILWLHPLIIQVCSCSTRWIWWTSQERQVGILCYSHYAGSIPLVTLNTFCRYNTCHQRDAGSIKCRRRRWRNWTQCRGWDVADVSTIHINCSRHNISLFIIICLCNDEYCYCIRRSWYQWISPEKGIWKRGRRLWDTKQCFNMGQDADWLGVHYFPIPYLHTIYIQLLHSLIKFK